MRGTYTLERIPHEKQVAIRALTLSGFSYRKIAKIVDTSQDTIVAVNRLVPSNTHGIEQYKKQLIAESYSISTRAAIRVTDEKLDACSAPQLAMVSGVFIDKARDIEGLNRPQFNIMNVVADCEATQRRLDERFAALQARKLALSTEKMHCGEQK